MSIKKVLVWFTVLAIVAFSFLNSTSKLATANEIDGPPKVFLYVTELEENHTYKIEPGYPEIANPSIHSDNIVYYYDDGLASKIALYNIVNNQSISIGFGTSPSIWNNTVVYRQYDENSTVYSIIKIYDIRTNDTLSIKGDEEFYYPNIYQNFIVWSSVGEIYLYNLSNRTFFSIEKISSLNTWIRNVDIFGNYIIFDTIVGTDNTNYYNNLYLYNIKDNDLIQLDTPKRYISNPQIWNQKVVWMNSDRDSKSTISMLNITTMQQKIISETVQTLLGISQNFIVWTNPGVGQSFGVYNITSNSQSSLYLDDLFSYNNKDFGIYNTTMVLVGAPYWQPMEDFEKTQFLFTFSIPFNILIIVTIAGIGKLRQSYT